MRNECEEVGQRGEGSKREENKEHKKMCDDTICPNLVRGIIKKNLTPQEAFNFQNYASVHSLPLFITFHHFLYFESSQSVC